jgi:hypothetical protein
MIRLTPAAAVVALLSLTACERSTDVATAPSRLDCPARQGQLQRIETTPDGRACGYRTADGTEVSLRLMPVTDGDPQATLAAVEAELRRARGGETPAPAEAAEPAVPPSEGAAAQAAAVVAQASQDAGVPVVESTMAADPDPDDSDRAEVHLPGLDVSAHDESAKVRVGPIHINANGDDAEIRVVRDVRLKGQAMSRHRRGIRATFILAGEAAGKTYDMVGYEARGPKAGPLTVAVVKSRNNDDFDDYQGDVRRLLRRNSR